MVVSFFTLICPKLKYLIHIIKEEVKPRATFDRFGLAKEYQGQQ